LAWNCPRPCRIASRDHSELRVEFDVAREDLAFSIRTLRQVLPEAAVEEVRRREFGHRAS
jgi:hypothetical protein